MVTGVVEKPETVCIDKIKTEYWQNMANLLESGKHSDVSFVIGDAEFTAHKAILSTRSEVFAAMFEHQDTKEAQEGKVEICDIPSQTFKELLRFLYTGNIPSEDELTEDLLVAAEKVTCTGLSQ